MSGIPQLVSNLGEVGTHPVATGLVSKFSPYPQKCSLRRASCRLSLGASRRHARPKRLDSSGVSDTRGSGGGENALEEVGCCLWLATPCRL